ncbi:MAG: hypothetical protein IJ588_06200 [Prevotella sp.]|nr:hypothetical protein [Prevotella sp.]
MTNKRILSPLCRYSRLTFAVLTVFSLIACPGSNRCSREPGGDGNDEQVDNRTAVERFTDDVLGSFDPDVPFTQNGHSRAFTIHPAQGLTISADAGAFEEDVNMTVTEVPIADLKRMNDELQRDSMGLLLTAWDISAGLPHDSVIPGKYKISIKLADLDIPQELAPSLRLVRHRADGKRQVLNTRVKNGSLECYANQNSILEVIVVLGAAYYTLSHYPEVSFWFREFYDAGVWPNNWWKGDDGVFLHFNDEFGNFNVCFRYTMTEDSTYTQLYFRQRQELEERHALAERRAYQILRERWPNDNYSIFDTPEKMRKSNTHYAEALMLAIAEDERLQELANDPLMIPQSVQDIINGVKMATRYCRTVLKMKPLSEEFTVYLSPRVEALYQEAFRVKVPLVAPYVMVNYEGFVNKPYQRSRRTDCMMVTLAHELMHVFQTDYLKCSLLQERRFFEALGSWVEHDYAAWMKQQGYIDYDPEEDQTMSTGFSGRDCKELLANSLFPSYPARFGKGYYDANTEGGYMLGDFLQWMQLNKGKRDGNQMMTDFDASKGFGGLVRDIWGQNEEQFRQCFKDFCQAHMREIATSQASYSKNRNNTTDPIIHDVTHSMAFPVMHISQFGSDDPSTGALSIRTIHIKADSSVIIKPYSLFAVDKTFVTELVQWPSTFAIKDDSHWLSFVNSDDFRYTEDPLADWPCKNNRFVRDAYAAYLQYGKGSVSGNLDIVALYRPTAKPSVRGRSRDGRGLNINVGETPPPPECYGDYLTGMQISIRNNKTQQIKTYRNTVDDWKDRFVAPYDALGITDTIDIDLSLQSRWYYQAPDGKRFFSPTCETVKYEHWRSHERQTEEATDTTVIEGSEQETTSDMERVLVDKDVRITRIFVVDRVDDTGWIDIDDNTFVRDFYGHLTIRDDQFTFSVPSHEATFTASGSHWNYEASVSAFTISGTCHMEPSSSNGVFDMNVLENTMSIDREIIVNKTGTNGSDRDVRDAAIRIGTLTDKKTRMFAFSPSNRSADAMYLQIPIKGTSRFDVRGNKETKDYRNGYLYIWTYAFDDYPFR